MRVVLKNEQLTAEIDTHGAEIKSIKRGDREYMWCADPKFWGRTSPVLFPFVGAVADGKYRYEGKEYPMSRQEKNIRLILNLQLLIPLLQIL